MTTPYREADPLGALVSEHPVSLVQQGIRIGVGVFCVIVALDCLAMPIFVFRDGEPFEVMTLVVLGLSALVFGALAVWIFSHFWRARGRTVSVHEAGLRIGRRGSSRDLRWVDIHSIGGLFWEALGDAPPEISALWLDDPAGDRVRLPTPVRHPYSLGREIASRTFESRLKLARERLAEGRRIHFGRCSIDEHRLFLGEDVPIERASLKKVKLTSRWIEMRLLRGGKRLVPTEEVPDTDVLLAILAATLPVPSSKPKAMG